MSSEYIHNPEMIRINSEFQEVDPKTWKDLDTITVCVGTGALDKSLEVQNANSIIALQAQLMQSPHPEAQALLDPIKAFNAIQALVKAMGYKTTSQFFNAPESQEYQQMYGMLQQKMNQPPPPDPQIEFIKVEQQKMKQGMIIDTAEFELKKLKEDRQWELDKFETQFKYELELAKLGQKDQQEIANLENALLAIPSLNPSESLLPESQVAALREVTMLQGYQTQPPQQPQQPSQMDAMMTLLQSLNTHLTAPKKILRDQNGNIIGSAPITTLDKGFN
jgi:hypothetical protein